MTSLADKILKRVQARKRNRWVCTPKDFLDLGKRAAVDQALSRLVKRGVLRRAGRGLYDVPVWSDFLRGPVPVSLESAIDALMRRDGIRIMPADVVYANMLHLTDGVPAKPVYVTDGPTRNVKVQGRTLYFRHAGPKVMSLTGTPSLPVVLALRWFGPRGAATPKNVRKLQKLLPDWVKDDLVRNSAIMPLWMARVVHDVVSPQVQSR